MDMKIHMRFPGGKPKAFTMSYDDGVYQDLRLIAILDQNGLKCTFNLNSGNFSDDPGDRKSGRMTREDVLAVYGGSVHEAAVHALTHPHLERIPADHAAHEILMDRKNLESLFGTVIRGGAYPFGSYSDEVVNILKSCGIAYFRTTRSTESFDIPVDWLRMPATCHHKNPRLMELAERFVHESPDAAEGWRRDPWLFYVWGHSYEFDENTGGNSWESIQRFCKFIGGKSDIWYATNIQVHDYVEAFRSLRISLNEQIVENPNAAEIFFEFDDKIYTVKPGETITLP